MRMLRKLVSFALLFFLSLVARAEGALDAATLVVRAVQGGETHCPFLLDSLRAGMGSDFDALVRGIRETPEDDVLRLIAADALTDSNAALPHQAERAELIRIQIELSRRLGGRRTIEELPEGEREAARALRSRADELLWESRISGNWLPRGLTGAVEFRFRRGLIDGVAVDLQTLFANGRTVERATAFLAGLPDLTRLEIRGGNAADLAVLLRASAMRRITELTVNASIGDGGAAAIAGSPNLTGLRGLTLNVAGIRAAGAEALAASTTLGRLESLDLSSNTIGQAGAQAIAGAVVFRNLRTLVLRNNALGPLGALAISMSPNFRQLTTLDLAANQLGTHGARALAGGRLRGLVSLNLGLNGLDAEAALVLASSPFPLASIERLTLTANNIGDAGLRALSESPRLARLTTLEVAGNDLGGAGIQAVCDSPHLLRLVTVDAGFNLNLPESARQALAAFLARNRARPAP